MLGPARRLLGADGDPPHRLLGLVVRVLQDPALVGDVQEIGVHRIRCAPPLLFLEVHRNFVGLGVAQQLLARIEIPFAPRCNDLHVGHQRIGAELEADLIVALAGRTVGDRVGAGLARNLDEALGDQRARDGCPQQVLAFVDRVGAKHGKHEVAHEFLAQVLDEDFLHPARLGLAASWLDLLALTDVGGERHHLAVVDVLQPLEDHGRVQPAGVGEHDLLHLALLCRCSLFLLSY